MGADNRLAIERQRLYTALAALLPGRVHPYPRPPGARVAWLGLWIGQPTVEPVTVSRVTFTVASFPIELTYDGADHAQVAGLDDLVSNTWDTLVRLERANPRAARPSQLTTDDAAKTTRTSVLTVDVTLTARTLCLPDVEPAEIPPTPIEEVV